MRTWYSILDQKEIKDPIPPLTRLVLEDGEYQEQSVLNWLREAGFTIFFTGKTGQMTVHCGRLNIPGHPDGILVLSKEARVLEIKGMNTNRFFNARTSGLEMHQSIRCQVQSYMDSWEIRNLGITKTQIYFKHKDSSRPHDIEIKYEPNWIHPIIETTCDILDGTLVPQPIEIDMCEKCSKVDLCWPGAKSTTDFSEVSTATMPEVEAKLDKGKYYESLGKMMKEEARDEIRKAFAPGTTELLLDNHRATITRFSKSKFDQDKFIHLFGSEHLENLVIVAL
jgi:hypothetical protein